MSLTNSNIVFRKLLVSDYNTNYLNLMNQLSTIDKENITLEDFNNFINSLDLNHEIYVLDDIKNNKIVGSGTIIIENKIIHNFGKVAHIEDIVVDKDERGRGYGKIIIDHLVNIGHIRNCYKTILNCRGYNEDFYIKCGFKRHDENVMAIYY